MKTAVHAPRRNEKQTMGKKKKYSRRRHQRVSLNMEYRKLRSLLPRSSKKVELQRKAGVVDAAYQYIRKLQSALLDKFSSRGLPPDLAGVVGNKVTTAKDVQTLALHLIKQNNNNNTTNNNNLKDHKSDHNGAPTTDGNNTSTDSAAADVARGNTSDIGNDIDDEDMADEMAGNKIDTQRLTRVDSLH